MFLVLRPTIFSVKFLGNYLEQSIRGIMQENWIEREGASSVVINKGI
jgi:hypothetical protein